MTQPTLYFRPRNWSKFQSHSNNSLPWIKNYTALLSDPDYLSLNLHQRGVLHGLWLLYGIRRRALEWSIPYLNRALRAPCRSLNATLGILKSRNFIELCDATFTEERRGEDIEEKRRDKTPPMSPSRGKSDFDLWFEDWWKRHPRKIGKAGCKRKIQSLLKAKVVSREKLDLGLAGLIAKVEAEGTETQYIAHPLTWLNQGRWDDDHTTRRKMTEFERLEAWANGDERDDHGVSEIDGEYVDLSGQGSGDDGCGLSPGIAGVERRGGKGRGNGTLEQLGQDDAPEAGGYHGDREGNKARIQQALAVATKRAKP